MKHSEFSWQSSDGVQFFAQEWVPDKTPIASITLVHGLGEHSSRYQHFAEYYCNQGISVLSYDQRGHGKTSGKLGHIPSYDIAAEDIKHFIFENKSRHPDNQQFLYGHSLGGAMALYYTLKVKSGITGTIVTDPGLAPGDPVPPAKLFMAKLLSKLAPSLTMTNGLDRSNLSRDVLVVQRYDNDPLVHDQISASLAMNLIRNGEWMLENANTLELPLLLMFGTADHLVNLTTIRDFAAHVNQNATIKEWDGLYHEIHNEPEKTEVFDFTIKWIKSKLS